MPDSPAPSECPPRPWRSRRRAWGLGKPVRPRGGSPAWARLCPRPATPPPAGGAGSMAPRLLFGRGWRIQWSIVPEVSEVAVSPREARGSSTSARSGLGLGPLLVPRGLLQLCGRPPGALPRGGRGGEGPPPQPGAPGSCTPTPRQPTRPCLLCARLGCSGGGVPADPSQPGWDVLGGGQQGGRAGLARWAREQIRCACRRALRMKFYRCAAAHVRSCTRGCGSRAEEL